MKRRGWSALAAAVLLAAVAVGTAVYGQAGSPAAPAERVVFRVEGLSCGSCEGKVKKALQARPGVRGVEVNLDEKTVAVDYEKGAADPKELGEAITRLGYPAKYLASGPSGPAKPASRSSSKGCGGKCCEEKGS